MHFSNAFNKASAMLALVGAITAGTLAFQNQKQKREADLQEIPLAFSEGNQIRKIFAARGQSMPIYADLYSKAYDTGMKIIEASNLGHERAANGENLHSATAKELQLRMKASTYFDHDKISEYLEALPDDAKAALEQMQDIIDAAQSAEHMRDAFEKAWNYDYEDIEEWSEFDSAYVYSHTEHEFDYYEEYGVIANKIANEHSRKYPNLDQDLFNTLIFVPEKIGSDNENAMIQSRSLEEENAKELDAKSLVSEWIDNSPLNKHHDKILEHNTELIAVSKYWQQHVASAQSVYYTTNIEGSDAYNGPIGYRIAEDAKEEAREVIERAEKIVAGMRYIEENSPKIAEKINRYIDVVLNGENGNSDDLREEILQMAIEWHEANFSGGFDVAPRSWLHIGGITFLFTLMGALGGLGIGYGASAGLNKYRGKNNRHDEYNEYQDRYEDNELSFKERVRKRVKRSKTESPGNTIKAWLGMN